VTPRLRRLDALRNDKGPNSGPLPDRGSNSDPARTFGGQALDPSPPLLAPTIQSELSTEGE
jgi:hypothetical protein